MKHTKQPKAQSIEEIDSNFKAGEIGGHPVEFYDATRKPFGLTGFPWFETESRLWRLPADSVEKMERIRDGAWQTAGGRIRFRTDSELLAVKVTLTSGGDMSHMPRTGSAGVDLFRGRGAEKTFVAVGFPPAGAEAYDALLYKGKEKQMCDWTLNLPLYNGVKQILIGVSPGAKLYRPAAYAVHKPILFYGGSITQGGCASRPGNAFTHLICDWLDAPLINLGFSGCAMLEPIMATIIASLDLGVLMIDTTNTSLDQKRERYEPFFRSIRERQPDLPIVLGCRPDWRKDPALHRARRAIVLRTYHNALKRGDKRVFFADGRPVYGKYYQYATVDGCHPNDLGFMCLAEAYYPAIKRAVRVGS